MSNVEGSVDASAPVVTPVAVATEKKNIPGETFVRVFNQASSNKDAVARFAALGFTITVASLCARRKALVKKGVTNLKVMPRETVEGGGERKGRKLNVEALNAIAAQVTQEIADAEKVKQAAEDAAKGDSTPTS